MARVKLIATMTATFAYDVEEGFDDCATVADLCRHEETRIREDPTGFCDITGVKCAVKVAPVREKKGA